MSDNPWHILGAGAIGCLFAAKLKWGGLPVTLLLRASPAAETLPVTVASGGKSRKLALPAGGVGERSYIAQLLVTTKAQDVVAAVMSVADRLDQHSQVLLLANGMGFATELQRRLPQLDIYSGTTTEGAYRTGPRQVCHAGHGRTLVGRSGQAQPPDWFARWSAAIGDCHWEPHIDRALWEKLAVNCAINPLTALHRCNNGELLRDQRLAREVDRLCEEISQVSDAAGFMAVSKALRATVGRVITATADNRSSMLQDVLAGRPTEIDYITGHLVATARQVGIRVPFNEELLQRIRNLASTGDGPGPAQR